MATVAASAAPGALTVTGSGYTGTLAVVGVSFVSSDGRRHHAEMVHVPVSGGAINATVKFAYAGGTAVVKTFDAAYVPQATSSNQAV